MEINECIMLDSLDVLYQDIPVIDGLIIPWFVIKIDQHDAYKNYLFTWFIKTSKGKNSTCNTLTNSRYSIESQYGHMQRHL